MRLALYLKKFFQLEVDEKRIINIIEKTSFKNFRKNEDEGKFYENAIGTDRSKKIKFFFLGPENNWQKLLKQKTIIEIENKFGVEMKELKYI